MSYLLNLRKIVGYRPLLSCGATVIVREGDRVLLNLRSDTKTWGIPGGALEPGERIEETAARELKEETGLTANHFSLLTVMSGDDFYFEYPNGDQLYSVVILFQASGVSGELRIGDDESTALKYFPLDDLPVLESRASAILDWYKEYAKSFVGCGLTSSSPNIEARNKRGFLNSIYSPINLKVKNIESAFKSLLKQKVETGFYKGHFVKNENNSYECDDFPIPVVSVEGICDIEFNLSCITITSKLKREDILTMNPEIIPIQRMEVYGIENYLNDYYSEGMDSRDFVNAIERSDEKEFFISFQYSYDIEPEKLAVFVELLYSHGFYY